MHLCIIGCGSIGMRHLRLLQETKAHSLSAFDVNPERRRLAETFGARTFASLADALADRPEAALICSPTHLHAEHAMAAALAGCHLFVEKPLSHSLDAVDALLAHCAKRGRKLMVAYPYRFHPCLRQIKTWLEAGEIGEPLCANIHSGQDLPVTYPWKENYAQGYVARREWGGGVTLDYTHELDYAGWFFGPADEVAAVCVTRNLKMETEDLSLLTVRYRSGVLLQFNLNYLDPVMTRRCEITGTDGMIRWDENDNAALLWTRGSQAWRIERSVCPDDDLYRAEQNHFLASLEAGEQPSPSGAEGRESVALALTALQASAERRTLPLSGGQENP